MSSIDGGYRDYNNYTTSGMSKDFANAIKKDNSVKMDDFFKLFAAQLSNQDFLNPMDNSQFLTQMAQFQSMQSMQNLAESMNNSMAISMVGKAVRCADFDSKTGKLYTVDGMIEKVSMVGGTLKLYVKGKRYDSIDKDGVDFSGEFTMDKVMEIMREVPERVPSTDDGEDGDKVEGSEGVEGGSGSTDKPTEEIPDEDGEELLEVPDLPEEGSGNLQRSFYKLVNL